jgi:hypothetical protein
MGIAVSGAYALVADNVDGLQVLRTREPGGPVLEAVMADLFGPTDVAVSDRYAYVTGYDSLYVVDIENADTPSLVAAAPASGMPSGLAVANGYAYAASTDVFTTDCGLEVFDVRDPRHPTSIGTLSDVGVANDVAVAADMAYVVSGPDEAGRSEPPSLAARLYALRITEGSQPRIVGYVDLPATLGTDPSRPRRVGVAGHYAAVANWYDGLVVVDVADPASPHIVATYSALCETTGVAMDSDLVYVADSCSGLVILRLAQGEQPTPPATVPPTPTDDHSSLHLPWASCVRHDALGAAPPSRWSSSTIARRSRRL